MPDAHAVTAEINGVTIAYTDRGEGPMLLLLHGHAYDRSMWARQVEVFAAEGWRVVAPDLRGFGGSGVTEGIVYTEEFADDVVALLDHLGVAQAVVVGFSMAGQVAMEVLHRHPERMRALVIADTVPEAEDREGRRRRHTTADGILTGGMEAYGRSVLGRMLAPATVESQPGVAAEVLAMLQAAPAKGAAAAMRGRAERRDFTEVLRDARLPVLVVVGADDAFDGGAGRRMADLVGGAELAVVPGAGHTPSIEQPVAFDDALGAFLRRLDP
ncbi:alpha/beta fold hydrolase [Kocuria sp. M1R5S2]|uniref:alpha/beta fold hydrolase n=1 Tax=Kocuria rhizosphaerae TaxID=3376285 RepID=UPI003798AD0E